MLDPEIPPEVAGGEADGGADVARRIAEASTAAVIVSRSVEFTPLPWTTIIAVHQATKARAAAGVPDSLRPTLPPILSHFRPTRMPLRASSPSLMIYFFRRRFRKPRAS